MFLSFQRIVRFFSPPNESRTANATSRENEREREREREREAKWEGERKIKAETRDPKRSEEERK